MGSLTTRIIWLKHPAVALTTRSGYISQDLYTLKKEYLEGNNNF